MIKTKLLAGIATLALLAGAPAMTNLPLIGAQPVMAQSLSVSFGLFFDELEPHGIWVRHPRYRYVWCPTDVDRDWRPYTNGRWIYTREYGWYFESDEPFAWAAYHYGRWHDDDDLGWCWVPGTRWAPAWVSWRRSSDYIGWAPLPPEGEGFSISIEIGNADLPEDRWYFVPVRRFVEPELRFSIVFGDDDPDIFERTEYVGPVIVQNNVVINNTIDIDFIQEQTQQEVTVYQVEQASSPDATAAQTDGNTVQVFTAAVEEPTEEAAPAEAVEVEEAEQQIVQQRGAIAPEDDATEAEATTDAEAGTDEEAGTDPEAATATDAEADAATDDAEADADADATTDTETDAEVNAEEEVVEEDEAAPDADATEGTDDADAETTTDAEVDATEDEVDAEVTTEQQVDADTEEVTDDADAAVDEATDDADAAADEATDAVDDAAADDATEETGTEDAAADDAATEEEAVEEDTVVCATGEVLVEGVCVEADADVTTEEPADEETAPAEAETGDEEGAEEPAAQ